MSDCHCLQQLDDLHKVLVHQLEVLFSELVVDGVDKEFILLVFEDHSWEQVINDTSEERKIMFQEFGHVGVSHGSDEELLFGHRVILSSQLTSHD